MYTFSSNRISEAEDDMNKPMLESFTEISGVAGGVAGADEQFVMMESLMVTKI